MKLTMQTPVIIVTGSRMFRPKEAVWEVLDACYDRLKDRPKSETAMGTLVIRHGDCRVKGYRAGADRWAHEWCFRHPDVIEVMYPVRKAEWQTFGKGAGPRRNERMVKAGGDLLLAFPLEGPRERSKGTWNCIDLARAHNIPVVIWGHEQ